MKISKLEYVKLSMDMYGKPYHDYCEHFGFHTKHLTSNEAKDFVDQLIHENGITVSDEPETGSTTGPMPITEKDFLEVVSNCPHTTLTYSLGYLVKELKKRGLIA